MNRFWVKADFATDTEIYRQMLALARRWAGPHLGRGRLQRHHKHLAQRRNHFASWNATAPIDASSGDQRRHRLARAGNRRINRSSHIMAIVQLRHDTEGPRLLPTHTHRRQTPREALRCLIGELKRRPSDTVYKQLLTDARGIDSRNTKRARKDTWGRL